MDIENELELLNNINPDKGIEHLDYIKQYGKRKEIFIPDWLSKILNTDLNLVNGYKMSNLLRKQNIKPQVFYDSVILGLTSIDQRPTCPICGSKLKFRSISHGYEVTCSKECHKELKRISYLNNPKMIKSGDKLSKITKEKISDSLKGRKISDETRKKRSEYMKSFAKTEKGKEFYKRVGEINANSNRLILSGEKKINTLSGYYVNSRFKRGIIDVPTFNKTLTYDSGWEKLFIEYFLDEINIKNIKIFDRCKQGIPYLDQLGRKRNYFPDFYIQFVSGIRLVIEIKPKHLLDIDDKVKLKIKAGEEFFKNKGIKYLIFTEDILLERKLGKLQIKSTFDINTYNN